MKKITFLLFFTAIGLVVNAQISRYIKVSATGTGDGTSWANAAGNADIQLKINEVAADVNKGKVYFAGGTYLRATGITIKDGVNLVGGYSPDGSVRNLSLYQTILDGQANSTIRLLTASAKTLAAGGANAFNYVTTIDGIVLQNGASDYGSAVQITYGVVLQNCIIRNNNGNIYGMAVYAKKTDNISSPTVGYNVAGALINCIIVNNSSANVAGAFWANADAHFSMINCVIANNYCSDIAGSGGLTIYNNIQWSKIVNNIFYNNISANSSHNNISSTLSFEAVYSNYFSDLAIPITFSSALTSANPSNGNKTALDIADPDFVSPTSFEGASQDPAKMTEIYNSNWRLKKTSSLINLGANPSNRGDMPYPYSKMASYGSKNRLYSDILTDIAGTNRVIGTAPDMGAYEYDPSSGVENNVRLLNANVFVNENNYITINTDEKLSLTIYNSLGQKLLNQNIVNNQVINKEFKSGIYFVELSLNGKKAVQKVIIR